MQHGHKSLTVLSASFAAALMLAACSGSGAGDSMDTQSAGAAPNAASVPDNPQQPRDAADREAVTSSIANKTPENHGMKVVGQSNAGKVYLSDLLDDPAFSDALDNMDGVDKLPAWVSKGGTATPSKKVKVDDQAYLAAQACKPHNCPSEEVLFLFNDRAGSMQGVLAKDANPGPDAGISDDAQLTWLGNPDDNVKAWLKHRLQAR